MMAILCQAICGVLLLSFLSGSHAVPEHAQRARRSSDVWSDCSVECGGGTRWRVETYVDCNVFSCDFQPSCSCGEADILFIVDHSASIGESNYWQQKQFMIDLMTGLDRVGDVDTRTSRVAVVSFGINETVEFDFNDGYSVGGLSAVVDKIWQMPYRDGMTHTASALAKAAEIFDTQGRLGPKRIAILVTDGASTVNPDQTIPRADDLKDTGAFLYAIGIGQVDVTELRAIASKPSDLFYFYAADYQHLDTIMEEVLNGLCCYSTTAATTVPTVTPDPTTAATTVPTVTLDPATAVTTVPSVTLDPATAATTVPTVTPDPKGRTSATSTDDPSSLTLALAVGFSISLSVVLAIAVTLAVRRCRSGAPPKESVHGPFEETINPAYDVNGRDSVISVIDPYYQEIHFPDSPDGA